MGIVVVPSFGADPVSITGPTLDAKVDGLATEFNGNIDNDNIKSSAAIVSTKLSLASISQTVAMTSKALNFAQGADIASATTTDIGAATGNYVNITGTGTITGFGTVQAGTTRWLKFAGACTLTHNATSLILPTGANITAAANDTALFVSEGSGNWRCLCYHRTSGLPLGQTAITGEVRMWGSTIASIPSGWLFCNGAAVSRSTYAALFAVIGTQYGAGDTTTTFNLPDMRNFFPVGATADDGGIAKATASYAGTAAKTSSNNNKFSRTDEAADSGAGFACDVPSINDVALGTGAGNSGAVYPNWVAFAFMIKT